MTVRDEKVIVFQKFTGLNIDDKPSLVRESDLTELTNLQVARAGNMERRYGIKYASQFAFNDTQIRFLGQFVTATYNHLFAATRSYIYYSNDNGATWIGIRDFNEATYACQYLDKFYILSLSGGIYRWDGTGELVYIAGSPSGGHIVAFKDRLWVCGDNSTLYYSNAGTGAETWPGDGLLRVSPGDGDRLTMVVPFSDRLILFKTRTTWNLYLSGEPSSWSLRILNTEHGCLSPYAAMEIDNLIYLISYDGMHRTDGVVFREVSNTIRPAFANRPFRFQFYQEDSLSYFNRYIWMTIQSSEGYSTYIYSIDAGAWTRVYSKIPVILGKITKTTSSTGVVRLMGGCRSTPSSRIIEITPTQWDDDSQTIACSFRTKRTDFNADARMIRGKVLNIIMEGTNSQPEIGYYWDGNKNTVVDVTNLVVNKLASYKVPGPGFFRTLEIYFNDDTLGYLSINELDLRLSIGRSLILEKT